MKKSHFNYYFSALLDDLHIDVPRIAESIDRHPSRFRHWKADGRPGRQIIESLADSLYNNLVSEVPLPILVNFLNQCINYAKAESILLPKNYDSSETSASISRYLCDLLLFYYELPNEPRLLESNALIEKFQLAQRYYEKSLFQEATELLQEILLHLSKENLGTSRELQKIYALSNRYLGDFYKDQLLGGNDLALFDRVLSYYQSALSSPFTLENDEEQALINKNLGILYTIKSNFISPKEQLSKALEYLEKSKSLYEKINSLLDVSRVLNNIGVIHLTYSYMDEVLFHCQKGIEVFEALLEFYKTNPNQHFEALTKINLATLFATQIDFFSAEDNFAASKKYFDEALSYFTIDSHPIYYANLMVNIANALATLSLYSDKDNYFQQAILHFKMALQVFTKEDHPELHTMLHSHLAIVHINTKAYEEISDEYHDEIKKLEASLAEPTGIVSNLQRGKTLLLLAQYYGKKAHYEKDLLTFKKSFDLFDQSLSYFNLEDYPHLHWKSMYLYTTVLFDYYPLAPSKELLSQLNHYLHDLHKYFTVDHFPNYANLLDPLKTKLTVLLDYDQ